MDFAFALILIHDSIIYDKLKMFLAFIYRETL